MKKYIALLLLLLIAIQIHAEEGDNLLKRVEEIIYPENVTYTAEMTIHRPEKVYKKIIRVYMKGYEKSLIEFLEPPRERDTRILMIGDNMWMYLPSIEKIIRLSGRVKIMGGEFIYDDIMRAKLSVDYIVESVKKNDEKIEMLLKAKDVGITAYKKIRLTVKSNNLLPIKSEFFTTSDMLLKILEYSEPRSFAQKVIPSILLMKLATSDDYKTVMRVVDYSDSEIPDRVFTHDYLKKGM